MMYSFKRDMGVSIGDPHISFKIKANKLRLQTFQCPNSSKSMPARIIALVPTFVAPSQSILFYILTYMRHPPIVGKDTWEAVQLEKERRKDFAARCQIQKIDYATDEHPFAGRVICGCCERAYGRKVWNSTDEQLRRIIWRCNNKYVAKGAKGCDSWHIDDGVLYKTFINTTT